MPTRVDIKSAANLARGYLADVMQLTPQELLLEEVELTEDQQFWLITFSYPSDPGGISSAIDRLSGITPRAYKVVKLRSDGGDFVSVKIRSLAAA